MNIITEFVTDVPVILTTKKVHWKLKTDNCMAGNDGGLEIVFSNSILVGFKDIAMNCNSALLLKGLVFTGDGTTLEKLIKDWAKQGMAFLRKIDVVETIEKSKAPKIKEDIAPEPPIIEDTPAVPSEVENNDTDDEGLTEDMPDDELDTAPEDDEPMV